MMDGQLMGEFEAEVKELEADSWSLGVEHQYLQQLDKELVKRQDVIYGSFQYICSFRTSKPNVKLGRMIKAAKCGLFFCYIIKSLHPVFVFKDLKLCLAFD